jgi:hypothetical protein
MLAIYSLTIFVSAFLLFSLEPLVGKMLLPRCGGTPSVWNTCIVFFQTVLLLGYAYTHVLTRLFGVRRQAAIHLIVILLPFCVLPVLFSGHAGPPTNQDPSLWLLVQLTLVTGLPFFVVSTTAPLLQRWFADTGRAGSNDPYFLYSTSNAGSLVALLSYPSLLEPKIGVLGQSHLWTAGYVLLAGLILGCAIGVCLASRLATRPQGGSRAVKSEAAIPWRRRLGWMLLAFVPSSLMLGATTHIATDIASIPLLWVIPLALYLLTFVLVFARNPFPPHSWMIRAMAYAVIMMPLFLFGLPPKFWMAVPVHLLTFFLVAMVCHGELARGRPEPGHLTEFYLWISLGGIMGGMFNTFVAPQVFTSVLEYPLMLVAACFLRPSDQCGIKRSAFGFMDCVWLLGLAALAAMLVWLTRRFEITNISLSNLLVFGVPAIICFAFRHRPIRFALALAVVFFAVGYHATAWSGDTLLAERDFFGVKQVCVVAEGRFHALIHGNTIHGLQNVHPTPDAEPVTYYTRTGPLGDVFAASSGLKPKRRVAVIGLGAGSMAAYARPGERFTFYEIDPAVVRIATNPRFFTFLRECRGTWDVILGDARLQIAQAVDHEFDLIVLDAFSSDSIPTHLLTREALQLYCSKLREDGLLVFHISNRYLNLEPVLAQLAETGHLTCTARADLVVTEEERREGKCPSCYLVMARHTSGFGRLSQSPHWSPIAPCGGAQGWTDDYSDIVSALRW